MYEIHWGTYQFHPHDTAVHHSSFRRRDRVGCGLNHPGLNPFQGSRFFSSKTSRLALGRIKPHIHWEMGEFSTRVHVVSRLTSGAIAPRLLNAFMTCVGKTFLQFAIHHRFKIFFISRADLIFMSGNLNVIEPFCVGMFFIWYNSNRACGLPTQIVTAGEVIVGTVHCFHLWYERWRLVITFFVPSLYDKLDLTPSHENETQNCKYDVSFCNYNETSKPDRRVCCQWLNFLSLIYKPEAQSSVITFYVFCLCWPLWWVVPVCVVVSDAIWIM